jgi:hypothetical protein
VIACAGPPGTILVGRRAFFHGVRAARRATDPGVVNGNAMLPLVFFLFLFFCPSHRQTPFHKESIHRLRGVELISVQKDPW